MAENQTFIVYEGPSLYDGAPIVMLVQTGSNNRKTGDIIQTYIIRSDIDPIAASRTGKDSAICGDCPHMGMPSDKATGQATGRSCYVTLAHGPLGKYKAYRRGAYGRAIGHAEIRALGLGRMIRLGTYGDPSCVPTYIWTSLISAAQGHTAYTHGAVNPLPELIMTSADNSTQAQDAWSRSERTFRVISSLDKLIKGKEILCPASDEARQASGKTVTCSTCKLCGGSSVKGKSVAIVAHGTSKRKAKELVE